MKRDDTLLQRSLDPTDGALVAVERRPMYLQEGSDACFGWYHWSEEAAARDCVAVICSPVGHEYTRAHRTVRHLADRLARAGIPALRFDYHGIGDSPGSDLDPARLATWQADIKTAICRARELSARTRVCLIGIRLGATLAALVAADIPVDGLVLWNPSVKGRAYVRELRAIALAAQRPGDAVEGALESGGFVMSAETLAALESIDLTGARPRVRNALLIHRDDLTPDAVLATHLAELGIALDELRAPGWAAMMAEHQFTVVPDDTLAALVAWAVRQSAPASGGVPMPTWEDIAHTANFPFRSDDGVEQSLEEQACAFGRDGHLFGICTRRASASAEEARARPAIVMLNAGAVHHVGPNRLYVALARHLAAIGYPVLRYDSESIGDSILRGAGRENHPYPDNALADVRAAIEYLRWEHGAQRFVVLGLCSGAHNAFHAALTLGDSGIEEAVLINPLTFYWAEGDSIETTRHFEDALQYRKSMRDPARWMKLLRGDVNFRRLFEVTLAQAALRVRSVYDGWCERFAPARAPRLARDLRRLVADGMRLALFVSDADPGRDILMAGARRTAQRAMREGALSIDMIAGADHTFSQIGPRRELVRRLVAHLRRAS